MRSAYCECDQRYGAACRPCVITSRYRMGEPVDLLAYDYGMTISNVQRIVVGVKQLPKKMTSSVYWLTP